MTKFQKLKNRLKSKFRVGDHQLSFLYDEIMNHFGVDGVEGEEVAQCVMRQLHEENFLEVKMNLFAPDMFYMLGD